jgi:hypothetical protein
MMTEQKLAERVAALDPDLSPLDVSLAVELHQNLWPMDTKPVDTIRQIAQQFARRARLERRAHQEELRQEEGAELARPAPARATPTGTFSVDVTPLGNILSRAWAKEKRAVVEQVRLELWSNTSAIADTIASAMEWRAAAPPETMRRLTTVATVLATDAVGTASAASAWETCIVTDAPPYFSAIELGGSPHRPSIHWLPGVTYKQVETVIKANREVLGLLPERSRAFDRNDDHFLAMVERWGGPSPEGKKEAWWGNVFIPRWNAAGLKPRYDDWHEPYQRHQRLMEKLRFY